MTLLERKAGAANVDPDDFNELVDAVVALGGSVTTRKAGAAAVDTDDFNAVVDAVVTLGSTVRDRKAGAAAVDPDDFNALIDAVTVLQDDEGGGFTTLTVNELVTVTAGYNLGDGAVYIPGVGLFSNTSTSTGHTIKWANPATDLATFTDLTYTNANSSQASSIGMCYDGTTQRLYQCFTHWVGASDFWHVKVEVIDPTDMSHSTLIDDTFGDSNVVFGPFASNITSDGTHLYLLTHTSTSLGPDCEMRKYRLSDGVQVATRTITGKQSGHPLIYDSVSGLLLMGGTSPTQHAWAGWMTTALDDHDTIEIGPSSSSATDDIIVRGTSFFLVDAVKTGPPRWWRIDKDLATFDALSVSGGVTGFCDGLFYDEDTDLIFVGNRTSSGDNNIVVFDGATLTEQVQLPAVGITKVNEIIVVGTTMYILTFEATSKVMRATLS